MIKGLMTVSALLGLATTAPAQLDWCPQYCVYTNETEHLFYCEGVIGTTCQPLESGFGWGSLELDCPDDCSDGCGNTAIYTSSRAGSRPLNALKLKDLYTHNGNLVNNVPQYAGPAAHKYRPRDGFDVQAEYTVQITSIIDGTKVVNKAPVFARLVHVFLDAEKAKVKGKSFVKRARFGLECNNPGGNPPIIPEAFLMEGDQWQCIAEYEGKQYHVMLHTDVKAAEKKPAEEEGNTQPKDDSPN
jgi:hypothetical protein